MSNTVKCMSEESTLLSNKRSNFVGLAKCNYSLESFVNKQINRELQASYTYRSLYTWAKYNNYIKSAKYLKKCMMGELEHADGWTTYQDDRRGKVELEQINQPISFNEIKGIGHVFELALKIELEMNEHLVELHDIADMAHDYHLSNYVDVYIADQVKDQRELEVLCVYSNCESFEDNKFDSYLKAAQDK